MSELKTPLSNVQLEILKAFSYELDEHALEELRETLAQFFAKRAIRAANQAWDAHAWSEEDVERMLNTKMRRSKG